MEINVRWKFRWNVTSFSIFKDILETVQIINNNNTILYDLNYDNIVLDFALNEISNYKNNNNIEYDTEINWEIFIWRNTR